MKAGWYEENGPANEVIQIGDIDTPSAGPNEVRVRLYASGVNPSDVKKRAGSRGGMAGTRIIPHSDGAGIIDQVGDNVDPNRIGERVWVFNGQYERDQGTAAEFITLPISQVISLPESVSFNEGACLGIPAMTAHRCLFSNGPITGRTILVTGGAGAVGNYSIQLAKWGNAKVITTISSDQKAELAAQAGADHIINYRSEDVIESINNITNGVGVDRIVEVDFGDNLPVTMEALKVNGSMACYASMGNPEPTIPFYPIMFRNFKIQFVLVYNMPDEAKEQAGEDIGLAINDGKLFHPIASVYPLEQLADAHLAVESGTQIGNVIVEIETEKR
jgi:NADPH2:quinone reductase